MLARGPWSPEQVRADEVACSWRISPDLAREIERIWLAELARGRRRLFDGPVARLEGLVAEPGRFQVRWSRLTYKPFFVLHMAAADLRRREPGCEVAVLGVSVLLRTSDGQLLLGLRNGSVAFYPGRIHPVAGAVEPRDGGDVIRAALREVEEELHVSPSRWTPRAVLGVLMDPLLRQPEVVVAGDTPLSTAEVDAGLSRAEHDRLYPVPADRARPTRTTNGLLTPPRTANGLLTPPRAADPLMMPLRAEDGLPMPPHADDALLTPVGAAALRLWRQWPGSLHFQPG